MREEGHSSSALLLSFLLGGAVGAGLALLMAPQAGSDTRQKIRDFTDDIKDKTTDYVDLTKEKMTSAVEKGKSSYEGKRSLIKSAIDAGKDAYEKEKEKHSKE
jgi:gas vesicle protein